MRTLDGPAVSCVVRAELRFALETARVSPGRKHEQPGSWRGAHAWGPASRPRTRSAAAPEAHAQSRRLPRPSTAFPGVQFSWLNIYNRWIVFTSFFMSNRRQRWAAMRSAFVKNPLSVSPELNAGSAHRNSLGGRWGCRSGLPTRSANAESLALIRALIPRLAFYHLPGKREDPCARPCVRP